MKRSEEIEILQVGKSSLFWDIIKYKVQSVIKQKEKEIDVQAQVGDDGSLRYQSGYKKALEDLLKFPELMIQERKSILERVLEKEKNLKRELMEKKNTLQFKLKEMFFGNEN